MDNGELRRMERIWSEEVTAKVGVMLYFQKINGTLILIATNLFCCNCYINTNSRDVLRNSEILATVSFIFSMRSADLPCRGRTIAGVNVSYEMGNVAWWRCSGDCGSTF